MHEMALAEGIIKIVLDYADKNQAKSVKKVALKIGALTNVEEESLTFCFSLLVKGTIAEKATLLCQKIPLRAHCPKCAKTFTLKKINFLCPKCQSALQIVSGRELKVDYLEVE